MKNGGYTLPPKRSPSITPSARGICAGSSGIARFATALGDKNAGCHAPPAVLVRGGSTVGYFASVAKPVKVRSVCRYSYGDTAIKGLSHRPSPLDTYIIPHNTEKVNSFFKNFLTDLDVVRLNYFGSKGCPLLPIPVSVFILFFIL